MDARLVGRTHLIVVSRQLLSFLLSRTTRPLSPLNHHLNLNCSFTRRSVQGSSTKGFSTRPTTPTKSSKSSSPHTHTRLVRNAVILQPDAASSDRLSLRGPSPWAWLIPSRPIGQRTRPMGVAWSQGNHPPKSGPHLFSTWKQAGVTGGKTVHKGCSLVLARRRIASTRCLLTAV